VATREQDRLRRTQMRTNGPMESFTVREIGERDGWRCGICRDRAHLVVPARKRPDPLSPSIDHIVPLALGGTHTRSNVQIAHWFCNHEKNMDGPDDGCAELMRAKLARRLYGTPIPERVWRASYSYWSSRHERALDIEIALGEIEPETGTEPASSRLRRIAHDRGIPEDTLREQIAAIRAQYAGHPPAGKLWKLLSPKAVAEAGAQFDSAEITEQPTRRTAMVRSLLLTGSPMRRLGLRRRRDGSNPPAALPREGQGTRCD
jgi:5-methylcytosine-specific restriction endonuclease McrA